MNRINKQTSGSTKGKLGRGFWLNLSSFLAVIVAAFSFLPGMVGKGVTRRIDTETRAICSALIEYRSVYGAFPTGDDRTIGLALAGENPRGIRFTEIQSVTPEGGLLDPWGTPYRIYFSGEGPLIRSAGPNKQFDSSTTWKQTDDYFGG